MSNSGAADDLAIRVQGMYARIAGKLKLEAQIDFLNCLRTWCPFYGSTFFEVQCQYDYTPLDSSSTPPVIMMNVAVGPLAVFLITATDPPVIMRHPYKRIIKWIAHPDKHIFTYWVIKAEVTLADMEQHQQNHTGGGDFDARPYCDCVYLVSPQVRELEYLVHSYVQCRRNVSPCLAGAPEELQDLLILPAFTALSTKQSAAEAAAEEEEEEYGNDNNSSSNSYAGGEGNGSSASGSSKAAAAASAPAPAPASRPATAQRRASRLGVFLNALGAGPSGGATSGTGFVDGEVDDGDGSNAYGDDTAAVGNSLFKNMYKGNANKSADVDDDVNMTHIPAAIKYASTMSELQKVAAESNFSDDEEGASDNDDDDEDDDDDDEEHDNRKHKKHSPNKHRGGGGGGSTSKQQQQQRSQQRQQGSSSSSQQAQPPPPPPPPGPPVRRPSMFQQATSMLFGKIEEGDDDDSDDASDSSDDNAALKKKSASRSRNRGGDDDD
jgi:hypothetical protein